MEVRPGYKQTEVGVIPQEWDALRVCEFGTVVTGGTPSTGIQGYWNGSYPWITPTDITEQRDMWTSERMVSESGLRSIRQLPSDSVLVTCIASIGKNAILRSVGGCNQQINAVVPFREYIPEFLYYLFEISKPYLLANAGMTATRILSKAAFEQLKFAIPPLPEQRAIAAALSDVDALLDGLDRLIAKKRDLKQAAMQQLLTGQTRLPGFHGEWEVKRLGDIADFCAGMYLAQRQYRDGPYDVQGAGASMGCHDTASIAKPLSVVGRVGTIGKPRFFPSGCWVNNNAAAVVAQPSAVAEYVHLLLLTLDWSKVVSVTAQPFLVVPDLMNMKFKIPGRDEQAAIARVLSDMEAELAALEARRNKTQDLKLAMMQELLTGKTRLHTTGDSNA